MRTPDDERALRSLKAMCETPAMHPALLWMERELKAVRAAAYGTTEPNALNRLVGEAKTISELLDIIGDAPNEVARRANADSAPESAPSQDWPMG